MIFPELFWSKERNVMPGLCTALHLSILGLWVFYDSIKTASLVMSWWECFKPAIDEQLSVHNKPDVLLILRWVIFEFTNHRETVAFMIFTLSIFYTCLVLVHLIVKFVHDLVHIVCIFHSTDFAMYHFLYLLQIFKSFQVSIHTVIRPSVYAVLAFHAQRHEILWFAACNYCHYGFTPLTLVCFVVLTGLASVTACCILVCCVNCFPSCLSPIPLPPFPPFLFLFYLSYPTFLSSIHVFGCTWFSLPPPILPSSITPSPFHSSLNSVNSSDSRGSSGSHSHSPSSSSSSSSSNHLFNHHHPRHRYRSSTLPQQAPARLSSISSHDSGFISSSHDQYTSSKSSSPMAAETKVRENPQPPTLDHNFAP